MILKGQDVFGQFVQVFGYILRDRNTIARDFATLDTPLNLSQLAHGSVDVCDFNLDGKDDFIALDSNDAAIFVAFGPNEVVHFERQDLGLVLQPLLGSVRCFDWDRDGDSDVIITGQQGSGVFSTQVYENTFISEESKRRYVPNTRKPPRPNRPSNLRVDMDLESSTVHWYWDPPQVVGRQKSTIRYRIGIKRKDAPDSEWTVQSPRAIFPEGAPLSKIDSAGSLLSKSAYKLTHVVLLGVEYQFAVQTVTTAGYSDFTVLQTFVFYDRDGDGYLDDRDDQCPFNPSKQLPGACGCSVADLDTDSDEVMDCDDVCYNDSLKVDPGFCGCNEVESDANGNGIPDCLDTIFDECPSDPNKMFSGICGCGTSDEDTNSDALVDCLEDVVGGSYSLDAFRQCIHFGWEWIPHSYVEGTWKGG